MKKLLVAALSLSIASAGVYLALDNDTYNKVKSGEVDLYCVFEDGERKINPEHIEDYDVEYGWVFFNGSAKNCRVE